MTKKSPKSSYPSVFIQSLNEWSFGEAAEEMVCQSSPVVRPNHIVFHPSGITELSASGEIWLMAIIPTAMDAMVSIPYCMTSVITTLNIPPLTT